MADTGPAAAHAAEWKALDRAFHNTPDVIQTYHDHITRQYALEHAALTLDPWTRRLRDAGARLVMDVGSGPGVAAGFLKDKGIPAVLVDMSHGMLKEAMRRFGNDRMYYVVADAEALPFRDGVFDGAIGAGILHHVPDMARATEEVLRATKPGALVAFAEPFWGVPPGSKAWYVFKQFIKRVLSALGLYAKPVLFERPLRRADVLEVARIAERRGRPALYRCVRYPVWLLNHLPPGWASRLLLAMNRGKSAWRGGTVHLLIGAREWRDALNPGDGNA